MNRFILYIILTSSSLIGYSQRTANVSATYTYYASETISVEEAKRIALDRAKIQAIADEFGTVVSQSTSTVITSKNGESDTQFFALGGSDVKGEWIETIGEPEYQLQFENHFLVVTCSVKGKAREIIQAKIDYVAKALRNGTTVRYEATEFNNGDDLYLYFKSPVDGFLMILLYDPEDDIIYRLLPYKSAVDEIFCSVRDKEYIFFSKIKGVEEERNIINEYTLNAHHTTFNTLYILFSPRPYPKPPLTELASHLPSTISIVDFNKWLSDIQKFNKDISIKNINLYIKNNHE